MTGKDEADGTPDVDERPMVGCGPPGPSSTRARGVVDRDRRVVRQEGSPCRCTGSCATLPTFISWLVGLYILKMDPMVLAGAVSGARNSTTAMRAISDKAKSGIPAFGYPVPYALSTVVFLIYGYLAMLLS